MGSRVSNFKVYFKSFVPPSARELWQSQNQVASTRTSMKSQWDEKAKKFVVVPSFSGLMGIALSFNSVQDWWAAGVLWLYSNVVSFSPKPSIASPNNLAVVLKCIHRWNWNRLKLPSKQRMSH